MNIHVQPCGCGACFAVMQYAASLQAGAQQHAASQQLAAQGGQAQAAAPVVWSKPPRRPAEGYLEDLKLASALAQKAGIFADDANDKALRDKCKTAREAIDEACELLAKRLER